MRCSHYAQLHGVNAHEADGPGSFVVFPSKDIFKGPKLHAWLLTRAMDMIDKYCAQMAAIKSARTPQVLKNPLPVSPVSEWRVIQLDGDIEQVRNVQTRADELRRRKFHVIKGPAACSLRTQPNDMAPSYRSHKQLTKQDDVTLARGMSIRFATTPEEAASFTLNDDGKVIAAELPKWLQQNTTVARTKRRALVRHLSKLPVVYKRSYAHHPTLEGFSLCGIRVAKTKPEAVLRNCDIWQKCTIEERQRIIDALPNLVKIAKETGMVDEKALASIGIVTLPKLDDLPLWRQRAVWITHDKCKFKIPEKEGVQVQPGAPEPAIDAVLPAADGASVPKKRRRAPPASKPAVPDVAVDAMQVPEAVPVKKRAGGLSRAPKRKRMFENGA